jgi:hypothetical protein
MAEKLCESESSDGLLQSFKTMVCEEQNVCVCVWRGDIVSGYVTCEVEYGCDRWM